jgi:hypothetical protein
MNTQLTKHEPTKICRECQIEKPIKEFYKRKISKDGFGNTCIVCLNKYFKKRYLENPKKVRSQKSKWEEKNPNYHKNWRTKNKIKIKIDRKQNYIENKVEIDLKNKQWRSEHKEEVKINNKKYALKNSEHLKQCRNNHRKLLRKTNISYKILEGCRRTIWNALKGICKSAKTIKLIGCTIPELRLHIEKLWLSGMTWDNWGNGHGKWNIDHIIPCSFFNMSDPVEQYMCFRWQNIQPQWEDNMKKGKTIFINNVKI